jgi:hypothetical protein
MITWDSLLPPIKELAEDEITLDMAAERLGVGRSAASTWLDEMCLTGKIMKLADERRRIPNGKIVRNIWKIK